MAMELLCTHQLAYRVGGATVVDALGWASGPDGNVARFFVPGFLPCGECPLCRRGLVGACAAAVRPLAEAAPADSAPGAGRTVVLSERFVGAVDEPPGVAALPDDVALLAGVVAFALNAIAVASLAPGDTAIWLGEGPVATAGLALCKSRDASAFVVVGPHAPHPLADQLAQLAAAPASAHGSRKRLLFITDPDAAAWVDAVALAEPGSTFVALGAAGGQFAASLTLPVEARVMLLSAYHPDFVPEALAALRRPELEPLRQRLGGNDPANAAGLMSTRL
jgi:threonine dehydrogenase-like Zn-dependent dehydrogenase